MCLMRNLCTNRMNVPYVQRDLYIVERVLYVVNRDLDISSKRPEYRQQNRSWHTHAWCAISARTQCTSHMSKDTCISSTKTYVYLRKRPVCRRFWFHVKSWQGIWVCGFGGFWRCSIFPVESVMTRVSFHWHSTFMTRHDASVFPLFLMGTAALYRVCSTGLR